jgi:hypothetical protein
MGSSRKVVKVLSLLTGVLLMQAAIVTAQEVCDADCNCDTKVNLADLSLIKGEFLCDDCEIAPCQADCNCDTKVDLSDLMTMKAEFLRDDCPDCDSEAGCTYTTTSSTTTTCDVELIYGRPGRRDVPFSCGDIIDFTLCTDCLFFDPLCLIWSVAPDVSWLSISQVDVYVWRLAIDSHCGEPGGCFAITVTDICNNASDTVNIEIL